MNGEIDHVFIGCAPGAPEADALLRLGLVEGSSNTHPGQGTACRRFFFENAYLELLWISDANEAQSPLVRPTRLWERCARKADNVCPFGIVLRPGLQAAEHERPFETWVYRPPYLPKDLAIEIARDTLLSEPELFYLDFQRGRARAQQEPTNHGLPATTLTSVRIGLPGMRPRSPAARAVEALGLVTFHETERPVMEMTLDGGAQQGRADLAPRLPLILRW